MIFWPKLGIVCYMKEWQYLEKQKHNLDDYIRDYSQVLVKKEDFTDELREMIKPGKSIIGYYDNKNVKFFVDGYDLIYFNDDGDLCHVKIKPEEVSDLERAGEVGEADYLEDQLMGIGFVFDRSEIFRSAIYRQLNRNEI